LVAEVSHFLLLSTATLLHLHSPSISHRQFSAGLKTHLFNQAYMLWRLLNWELNWST